MAVEHLPGGRRAGQHAVMIDAGGPVEPLLDVLERDGYAADARAAHPPPPRPRRRARRGARRAIRGTPVLIHPLERELVPRRTGTMVPGQSRSSPARCRSSRFTRPGHTAGMLSLLVNGHDVFTGDTLFKGSVGGVRAPGHTTYADLQVLDHGQAAGAAAADAHPSRPHRPDDGRRRARAQPFVRIWRGVDPEGAEPCTALGEPATLDAARRRLRRRPQGLGALARRLGRHRAGSQVSQVTRPAPHERLGSVVAMATTDPHLPRGAHGQDRGARGRTGDPAGGHARGQRGALEDGAQAALERRHIEAAEQIVDGARDDEGRRDEGRPGAVVPRRRARARGVPRGVPAQARARCATRRRRSPSRTCAR